MRSKALIINDIKLISNPQKMHYTLCIHLLPSSNPNSIAIEKLRLLYSSIDFYLIFNSAFHNKNNNKLMTHCLMNLYWTKETLVFISFYGKNLAPVI